MKIGGDRMKDIVGKNVRITFFGVTEIKGTVLAVDERWITVRYTHKNKVKLVNTFFISSIQLLDVCDK